MVQEIQTLFSKKLFVNVDSPEKDLFEAGILDSLSLVELLVNLEQAYGVKISLAELDLDDFRSVANIARLVEKSQTRTAGGVA